MKLFHANNLRMESSSTHTELVPGLRLESMSPDQLLMRLESLSVDQAMLSTLRGDSSDRPRIIAVENRYGLMTLESDVSLRQEGLGEWISNMIQKVIDAISKFFSWIFGSDGSEKDAETAGETGKVTAEEVKTVLAEPVKAKAGSDADSGIKKVGDIPVTIDMLRPHFKIVGVPVDRIAKQIDAIDLSLDSVLKLIKAVNDADKNDGGVGTMEAIKALGHSKDVPAGAAEGEVVSSFRVDGFHYTALSVSKTKDGFQFTKTALKTGEVPTETKETRKLDTVLLTIHAALMELNERYIFLLKTSGSSFKKTEAGYQAILKKTKDTDMRPLLFQARVSLALLDAVKSFGWIPTTLRSLSKEMEVIRATKMAGVKLAKPSEAAKNDKDLSLVDKT